MAGTGSASVSQRQSIAHSSIGAVVVRPWERVPQPASDQERAATFWRNGEVLPPQSGHWLERDFDRQMIACRPCRGAWPTRRLRKEDFTCLCPRLYRPSL